MPHAEVDFGYIIVTTQYRDTPRMRELPGARWDRAREVWRMPLSVGSMLSLTYEFGEDLTLDSGLRGWAAEAAAEVRKYAALKTAEPGAHALPNLYQFQNQAVRWGAGRSVLITDEMGLGKTIEAIHMVGIGQTLVVCTNSMKYKWADEFAQWAPGLSTIVYDGSPARRKKALAALPDCDVFIVNWESIRTLSRKAGYGSTTLAAKDREPGPLNRKWGAVIADEIHRAKDPKAKQTRALWAIGETAEIRIGLTGTPLSNTPEDVWSVMHFVAPDEWPSRTKFIDRYCTAGFNRWGGMDVFGLNPRNRAEFDVLYNYRVIRRTKAEVLPQLPPKTYETRLVSMSDKQGKAYRQMRDEMIADVEGGTLLAFSALGRLTRLIQCASAIPVLDSDGGVSALAAPSCKVDALLDLVEEANGRPIVVFAVSRKLVDLAAAALEVAHTSYVRITGTDSVSDRAEAVQRFQTGEVPVCLCTLGAGGEGVTLTAADTAVFLQRSYSLVQNLQAEDRIHRIGQEAEAVTIVDIITTDTVESGVHRTFGRKADLLEELVRDKGRLLSLLRDQH